MILRVGSGWQTITADLALILFLVTAQAVQEPEPAPPPETLAPSAPETLPIGREAEGLAVYRVGAQQDLASWVRSTLSDTRQAATVTVRYATGNRTTALETGTELLDELAKAGHEARLVVEPGAKDESFVVVGYYGDGETGTHLAE